MEYQHRRNPFTLTTILIVNFKNKIPMKKGSMTFILLLPIILMAQSNQEVTKDFLQSFADAFNSHDIKAIMSHMTDDCVFEASAGPDVDGEKFTGQEQVKKAFENVFATFADAKWRLPRHFISGDRGFTEWVFTGSRTDGTKVEVTGCDLFTFKDGKIAIKNSYRKNRFSTK
jgi:ketosteroid isomerase-like protein